MTNMIYDTSRINKISQIMPQFSKVAKPGDVVYMGLEGDPCFPESFKNERPTATVKDVDVSNPEEIFVTLMRSDGKEQKVSSLTLRPTDVWEFTDQAFRGVLEREQENIKSSSPDVEEKIYKGSNSLEQEIEELRAELAAEKTNTRNFQNTIIASMKEMAADILKLDGEQNRCEFSKVLSMEYDKMTNRAEASVQENRSEEGMQTRQTSKTPLGMFSESEDSMSDVDSDM